jgi:hypothetical protein
MKGAILGLSFLRGVTGAGSGNMWFLHHLGVVYTGRVYLCTDNSSFFSVYSWLHIMLCETEWN